MTSRRGYPLTIVSNRGTNFIGAERELRKLVDNLHQTQIQDQTASRGYFFVKLSFSSTFQRKRSSYWLVFILVSLWLTDQKPVSIKKICYFATLLLCFVTYSRLKSEKNFWTQNKNRSAIRTCVAFNKCETDLSRTKVEDSIKICNSKGQWSIVEGENMRYLYLPPGFSTYLASRQGLYLRQLE